MTKEEATRACGGHGSLLVVPHPFDSMTMSSLKAQRSGILSTNVKILIAFVVGILVGRVLFHHSGGATETGPRHGTVKQLDETPSRPTSHVDQNGKSIIKQQLLDAFVVPNFVGYSVATFDAGQEMTSHEHENLHEFFYVLDGKGLINIDGTEYEMKPGSFYHLAPHERHGIKVPNDVDEPMKMAVFGVTVGKR